MDLPSNAAFKSDRQQSHRTGRDEQGPARVVDQGDAKTVGVQIGKYRGLRIILA